MNKPKKEYAQEDPDIKNEAFLKPSYLVTNEEAIEKLKELYCTDPSEFFDILKKVGKTDTAIDFFFSLFFLEENEIEKQQEDLHINATNFLQTHLLPEFMRNQSLEFF